MTETTQIVNAITSDAVLIASLIITGTFAVVMLTIKNLLNREASDRRAKRSAQRRKPQRSSSGSRGRKVRRRRDRNGRLYTPRRASR